MMDCFAEYHAGQLIRRYGPSPFGRAAVLRVCDDRRVRVLLDDTTSSPGTYWGPPKRVITHRTGAPAWVIAHELFHDYVITADPEVIANFRPATDEHLCNRFAELLCGPSPFLVARPRAVPEMAPAPALFEAEELTLEPLLGMLEKALAQQQPAPRPPLITVPAPCGCGREVHAAEAQIAARAFGQVLCHDCRNRVLRARRRAELDYHRNLKSLDLPRGKSRKFPAP